MNRKTQEFFVPVHGYVTLDEREVEVVNHPAFQRLRRTRQLGFAHLAFPGGIHTRFEHSIGAVHVAQRIVTNVNENSCRDSGDHPKWRLGEIPEAQQCMIRIAALLHDIGHIPFGHTLEDELGHLPPHDDDERLKLVCGKVYPDYRPSEAVISLAKKNPPQDWSLIALIDTLYRNTVQEDLGISSVDPFSVVQAIISKEPPKPTEGDNEQKKGELEDKRGKWEERRDKLKCRLNLSLCRDVVGNTICADFLDYLYRDWHHIGKPLYEDTRIYQYMEARRNEKHIQKADDQDSKRSTDLQFVINIGSGQKIRHDALTSILQLLEARYELAETVLFHRSKLAITALLDRCLLELAHLYETAGISPNLLPSTVEKLLLDLSDDSLPDVLDGLATGSVDEEIETLISKAIAKARSSASVAAESDLLGQSSVPMVELQQTQKLIRSQANDLRNRSIYRLLHKLRYSDIAKNEGTDQSGAEKVVELYSDAKERRAFLNGLEALCRLPHCSLVMYCPPTKMNAKVADVKLLIEDEIVTFSDYDQRSSESNLSRGALLSRTQRFAELWSTQVFLRRDLWMILNKEEAHGATVLEDLRHVVRTFLVQPERGLNPNVVRRDIQPSISLIRSAQFLEAARGGTSNADEDELSDFYFPNGLSFRDPGSP